MLATAWPHPPSLEQQIRLPAAALHRRPFTLNVGGGLRMSDSGDGPAANGAAGRPQGGVQQAPRWRRQ